jgi:ectoine hydroxylase-related dioxygenase (phytanoyl-CoA dioxygenase family)
MVRGLQRMLPSNIKQLRDRFRREGFVVVPDLLTQDELDRYGRATDEAVARRQRRDHRALADKSLYEQSFIQCMNLWEDSPAVLPLTFHPLIGQVAAALIGAESLRLWHDQALYKQGGGRLTDPHQDQPYWPIKETDNLTAWIPFNGSTMQSGAMGYLPGSHLLGVAKFVNIFIADKVGDPLSDPAFKDVEPIFVEVPRGGVAFHHGLTMHLAKPNLSDRVRRVHTMIYFRDGSTRGSAFPHFSVERAKIAVGAPIDSEVTPIVWPRPAGDFPRAPVDLPWGEIPLKYASSGIVPDPRSKPS